VAGTESSRMVRTMLAALTVAALTALPLARPVPAEAQGCAVPNAPAATLRTVQPELPAIAQQAGIEGIVAVIVSLDEQSHLVEAKIQSSPGAVLNQPALSVVRHSAFRTETRSCRGIARDFVFTVEFEVSDRPGQSTFGGSAIAPLATVTGQGETTVAPDIALVHAVFLTHDAGRQSAVSANDAAFDAFRSKATAVGIASASIETGYYNVFAETVTAGAQPVPGYVASHEAIVTVGDFARIRDVLAAAAAAGASGASVAYSVKTSGAAYQSAKDTALRNAAAEAQRVATAHRLRAGDAVRTHVTNSSTESNGAVQLDAVPDRITVPAARPIAYRVNVTVTYVLKP
jgi:TonB family protein